MLEMADFVVVDTPPALTMADAHVAASMVDGVMVVISAQDVCKRPLGRAVHLLRQTGARLIGTVLNKADTGYGSYYGYYGYHYRYSHYYAQQLPEATASASSSDNGRHS
jgi:Mrp family chromosome partitioning ATPase